VARVELHLFTSGTLTSGGVTVPVPFFLIRHPDGDVLVDGGNPVAVARDPHAHWGALADRFVVEMSEDEHCVAQLEAAGLEPGSIRYVVQTHLHIDHTGALGHFPQATVVVDRRELDAARAADPPESAGYIRADIDRPELDWRPLDEETDLYADGAIRTVATPGHSAGHTSLLLTLPKSGAVLLTGDASDTRRQFDGLDRPRVLFSREEADRSLERLRTLAAETGALVVPGHDPDEWARLDRRYD
jgi:N-acyl homoserine lactone hydrolase